MDDGFQLQGTNAKGEGVFATRSFRMGETVMIGVVERELAANHSHASQVSAKRWVFHGGLVPKSTIRATRTAGSTSTPVAPTISSLAAP
jgi:hypothetical protein